MSFAVEVPEVGSEGRVEGARVGALLGVDRNGQPVVDFHGGPFGPVVARLAVLGVTNLEELAARQASVVLVFENADPALPIVVGVFPGATPAAPPPGARVVVEAEDELTLRCGRGSLTIRADGKILIHGTNVTSRATEVHKIKGASVRIN